jgi:hypothetical protein
VGSYRATAAELGLEGDQVYQVNFTAETAELTPDQAILNEPELSLGNLDHPDLAIRTRQLSAQIGVNSVTGQRGVLGVRVVNGSLSIFGLGLHLLQFPYYRGFVKIPEPGMAIPLPRVGWESDQGPYVDQSVYYNFLLSSFNEGPWLRFRVNTFPFDRTYPEISLGGKWNDLNFDLRTGYRREEDRDGDPVPTLADPELSVSPDPVALGDSGVMLRGRAFAGHLRDIGYDVETTRLGYEAALLYSIAFSDNAHLSSRVDWTDLYYGTSDNYQVLGGTVGFRYAEPPHWGATLSYTRTMDWGVTPFRFDTPKIREEIGLREQTRLDRRWGAGFDFAWDLDRDEFRNQELHATYIFDSFQVSVGWDLADQGLKIEFALPGSLK